MLIINIFAELIWSSRGLASLFCFSLFIKFAPPLTWVQPEYSREDLPIYNPSPYLQNRQFDSI